VGQKIHPIGFRLGITKEHQSRWYAEGRRYPELLQEDNRIRNYVEKNLANAGISQTRLERKADQIDLEIHTARPGVVVGRGGTGIEKLRTDIQQLLGSNRQVRINVIEVAKVDADASLIAEYIVQQLERRVSFRRIVRQAIQRAQRAEVKGIKIQVSGRLNGAEIARTEWVREGRVPIHTVLPARFMAFSVSKFGSSKAKSFPDKKILPPRPRMLLPAASVAANNLKIDLNSYQSSVERRLTNNSPNPYN
jgi:small subunit ribosomal protein S3